MTSDDSSLDHGFVEDRYLIEIRKWDWRLYLGPSHDATPRKFRFQGGLNYSRGLEVIGRIRAPSSARGKLARIWISTFGPKAKFGARERNRVGQLYKNPTDVLGSDFHLSLDLPESALSPAITCLSSVWKYLHVWTDDEENDEARITTFSFSADIHPNLTDWAGPELSVD